MSAPTEIDMRMRAKTVGFVSVKLTAVRMSSSLMRNISCMGRAKAPAAALAPPKARAAEAGSSAAL